MTFFSSLRADQREAVTLLQIGTFLEYFSLMLYVHMAILLNELFFPQTDPHTAALLTAVAFCSLCVMRPLGALFFGHLGDSIGRKATVIITTLMVATSCLLIVNLPTYEQIGVMAAWVITLCRVIQGFASMDERIGAELYMTESTKPPVTYPLVALVPVVAAVGIMAALVVASVTTLPCYDWRIAFWFGTILTAGGSIARTRLREIPDLVDMKRRMKKTIEEAENGGFTRAAELFKKTNPLWSEKIPKKMMAAFFAIHCLWPASFYFAYLYCGDILRHDFGYTAAQVIHQNIWVSVAPVLSSLLVVVLSRKLHPFKILKGQLLVFSPLMIVCPLILTAFRTPTTVCLIQCLVMGFVPSVAPASAILYSHFPIFKRFSHTSFIYAVSQTFIAIVASFGLVYTTAFFGYMGSLVIMAPLVIGFAWGVWYFEKLDQEREALCKGSSLAKRLDVA